MAKKLKLNQPAVPELPQKRTRKALKRTKPEIKALPSLSEFKAFKWISTTYKGRKWVKFNLNFAEHTELFNNWREVLKSEDVTGALVEVTVTIKYEDFHRFDAAEASKICQSAFYIKPIVPKVDFNRQLLNTGLVDDNIGSISVTPLDHVQNFIKLRNVVRKDEAIKIALKVIEGYLPDFKSMLEEYDRPTSSQIRLKGKRTGKVLKTSGKKLKQ